MTLATATELTALAARHGLALDASTMTLEEVGLDFRVGIVRASTGETWVLRVPRRAGMQAQIASEAAILDFVAAQDIVAVPRWTLRSSELIAYRAVVGDPGLKIDAEGQLHWRLDPSSLRYAEAFGALLAKLHGIDIERAREAGVEVEAAGDVRARWRRDIAKVTSEFSVAGELRERWQAWLDDDSYWPAWSVFSHGELYPAHVLIDADEAITGVIDWSTAKVSDPARDFAFQRAMASAEAFDATLQAYARGGGKLWPRLGEHAAELFAASPVAYGLYALQTGEEKHRAAAQAALAG
jgi:macrolide phosphotransferase